jgi:acetyl-CoA acyltransferase 2
MRFMKTHASDDIVFLAAKRTPFGTFLGSLKSQSATDLGVAASKAAITSAGINTSDIEDIIFGNVMQTSADAIYLARHIGLRCEIPVSVPALTVNRLCGSGFQAIITGAEQIALGHAQCVLVGGAESMTQAPHVVRGARIGLPLGQSNLEDSLWTGLTDTFVNMPMAITAENLATQYGITQNEVDAYSLRSQANYARAKAEGLLADEMFGLQITEGKKSFNFSDDEHPRPQTTLEGLQRLPKVFKKDGVIHAGAASGICDGAAALVMCSRSFAERKGLKPIGKIVNYAFAGCDPKLMGIGPVLATQLALKRAGLVLSEMDLIDVNEAFAPQVLAVQKELGIPESKFNLDGGAIALGHPLAASGARIVGHLLHALKHRKMRYGLGSACIGGGQGITVIVETL